MLGILNLLGLAPALLGCAGAPLDHPRPAAVIPAQLGARARSIAAGKFLVAVRDLPDPNFADSVVLLVHYGEQGAMGLIINRPTRLPISRVLKEIKEAQGRWDPVYVGGPVAVSAVLALVRSRAKSEETQHVFGDVHLVSSRTILEKTLAGGADRSALRVYMGHSGWAPGQLEREVELGSWHILPADAGIVFDSDPASAWSRMIRRAEQRLAFHPGRVLGWLRGVDLNVSRTIRAVDPPMIRRWVR